MAEKFRLHSVLKYRQSLEDLAQQQLATSLEQQRQLQAEIEQQQLALAEYDRDLKQRQQEGLSLPELELFEGQIQHCRRQVTRLQRQLVHLERRIVQEREALLQASRDRQVLVKLKEKQDQAQRRELSRQERAVLDEISLRSKGEKQ